MSVQSFELKYMHLGEIHMLINSRHKQLEMSSSFFFFFFFFHGLFAQYWFPQIVESITAAVNLPSWSFREGNSPLFQGTRSLSSSQQDKWPNNVTMPWAGVPVWSYGKMMNQSQMLVVSIMCPNESVFKVKISMQTLHLYSTKDGHIRNSLHVSYYARDCCVVSFFYGQIVNGNLHYFLVVADDLDHTLCLCPVRCSFSTYVYWKDYYWFTWHYVMS